MCGVGEYADEDDPNGDIGCGSCTGGGPAGHQLSVTCRSREYIQLVVCVPIERAATAAAAAAVAGAAATSTAAWTNLRRNDDPGSGRIAAAVAARGAVRMRVQLFFSAKDIDETVLNATTLSCHTTCDNVNDDCPVRGACCPYMPKPPPPPPSPQGPPWIRARFRKGIKETLILRTSAAQHAATPVARRRRQLREQALAGQYVDASRST